MLEEVTKSHLIVMQRNAPQHKINLFRFRVPHLISPLLYVFV